jgi:hypothetical protein
MRPTKSVSNYQFAENLILRRPRLRSPSASPRSCRLLYIRWGESAASPSTCKEAALRLSRSCTRADVLSDKVRPIQIYHLGDFDPSRVNAGEKIEETLNDFAPGADIHFERTGVRRYLLSLYPGFQSAQAVLAPRIKNRSNSLNFNGLHGCADETP